MGSQKRASAGPIYLEKNNYLQTKHLYLKHPFGTFVQEVDEVTRKRRRTIEIPVSILVLADTLSTCNKDRSFDNDDGSLFLQHNEAISQYACLYISINFDKLKVNPLTRATSPIEAILKTVALWFRVIV